MKIKNMVMNLTIVVLCFVFVVSLFYTVNEIVDYGRGYHPEEDSFLYSLKQQEYAQMVEMMYRNEAAGVESNTTYEECYAVARYYEAATYYKAYKLAGNEELAQEKRKRMDEQVIKMGEMSYAAGDIDLVLGIKEGE